MSNINKLAWETYESSKGGPRDEPVISILSKGGFGYSTKFIKKNFSIRPSYVELRYAEDNEYVYIGFSFTDNKEEAKKSLKIYYPKEHYGLIQATAFFKKYKLSPKRHSGKYQIEEINDEIMGRMFVIKLKK